MRVLLFCFFLASVLIYVTAMAQTAAPGACVDMLSNCHDYNPESCDYDRNFMQQNCRHYCDMCP